MVAYVVWDDVVAGSTPVTPNPLTKVIDKHIYHASLVQLVERRSPKPDVVGSSPTGREKKSLEESLVSQYTQCYTGSGEMTEWPKVLHC